MRYYISDLHFFHENLNHSLDCRGFASAHEMNEYIIEKWNKKVREGDEVVILGDFSAGHAEETNEVLRRLYGRLNLTRRALAGSSRMRKCMTISGRLY